MIIFDKNTKNLEVPAGLGNLDITIEQSSSAQEIVNSAVTEANGYTDSALTDYATTAVTETKLDKPDVSIGGLSRPIHYNRNIGFVACNVTILRDGRWDGLVGDVNGNTQVGQYLVFHSATTDNTSTTQFGKKASKGGFTVLYPTTGTDYTLNTNQHFVVDSDDIVHIKKITQADYDALVSAGTVDEHTLYLIEN